MKAIVRHLVVAAVLASLVGGCSKITAIQRPAVKPGSADLSRYMALGTSLTAGTESGGTVERHQSFSYANQFARAIGDVPFDRYTIDQDGLDLAGTGPMLNLISLSPLIIGVTGHTPGTPGNQALATDYHNLGVPGALLTDMADSTNYYFGSAGFHSAHFEWVARHRGTLLQQVARVQPTLISLEYGANEVLGPMTEGSGTPVFPVATWGAYLHGTLDGLQALVPGAKVMLFDVPDPTDLPFTRTFSWITLNDVGAPTPLLGSSGPLSPGTLVLLTAGDSLAFGTGFPIGSHSYVSGAPGNGRPLRDDQILTPAAVASLQSAVMGYNTAIMNEAAARGFGVVDQYSAFKNVAANGFELAGQHYTTAFVTGGLFSLDGIHPTDLGYGILANLLVDAVNRQFGASIPRIDLATCLTASSYRLEPAADDRVPYVQHAEAVYAHMFPMRGLVR